ncbi:hypothetical protein Syun_003211 [Stephania yunnanensis]|uniref:Uncharacterized protein n=1 Tax=Stephania yunnanensis TaxID=152371 RepID=A0AAP0Q1F2_9MAGN
MDLLRLRRFHCGPAFQAHGVEAVDLEWRLLGFTKIRETERVGDEEKQRLMVEEVREARRAKTPNPIFSLFWSTTNLTRRSERRRRDLGVAVGFGDFGGGRGRRDLGVAVGFGDFADNGCKGSNIKLKLQDHSEIQNSSCFGITKLNTRPYEADQARASKSQEEPEQVAFSGHTAGLSPLVLSPNKTDPKVINTTELIVNGVNFAHDDPRKHRNESKLGGVEDRRGGHREVGQPESVQEVIEANEDSDNGTGDKELGLHEEMSGLRVGSVA